MQSNFMQALEARVLLAADGLDFSIYSAEGFVHDEVTEVVTIANGEDVAAAFELTARYETGARDQVLASGSLAPGEIREIVIASAEDPGARLVRKATPFALELCSDGELSATLRHDDFGGVIVQAFSDDVSTTWSIGNAVKAGDDQRDFIVFYNPSDDDVTVTLTGLTESGDDFTMTQTVEGRRRGGWDLRREDDTPSGRFGLMIDATSGIVVSRSHYDVGAGSAIGQLAQAGGGALAGVILGLDVDDSDEDFPSVLTFFNAEEQAASVTLTIRPGDDDVGFQTQTHMLTLDEMSFTQVPISQFGLPQDTDLTFVYESDIAITAGSVTSHQGRLFGAPAVTIAATQWQFSSGSIDRVRDGELRTDDVYVFNPTGAEVDVTVTFTFSNGDVIVENKSLDPNESEDIDAELFVGLTDQRVSYTVTIQATGMVVASLEGFDVLTDAGFVLAGTPGGVMAELGALL